MRLALDRLHRARHERGFIAFVLGVVPHDAVAAALLAPEVLLLAIGVIANDRVGRVENGLRAAVVLIEHDRGDVVERLLELQDVPNVGAAPPVDRLIVITNDGDLSALGGQ